MPVQAVLLREPKAANRSGGVGSGDQKSLLAIQGQAAQSRADEEI
jgi:hypothetical protein